MRMTGLNYSQSMFFDRRNSGEDLRHPVHMTTRRQVFDQPEGGEETDVDGYEYDEFQREQRRRPFDVVQALKRVGILGLQNFSLAFKLRAMLAIFLQIVKLLRQKKLHAYSLKHMDDIVGETSLKFRVDAVSLGLFCGSFTTLYHGLRAALIKLYGREHGWHTALAGTVAGTSISVLDSSRRRTLALYLFARAVECWYNSAKAAGRWHLWGSHWKHGDSLLFIWTSAHVMYAYVMRPDTIPDSYYKFIRKSGPIHEEVLRLVRSNKHGEPMSNGPQLLDYVKRCGGGDAVPPLTNGMVPCSILHPHTPSCLAQTPKQWIKTFRKSFMLYLTITAFPVVAFRLQKLIRQPVATILQVLKSSARSTAFLSSFVGLYMATICAHRNLFTRDSKFIWFVAGLVSSLAIFIEPKYRRKELGLYVLPRAIDSVYQIMVDRKVAVNLPAGATMLFSASMGAIMYFFEHERPAVTPILRKLLSFSLERKVNSMFFSREGNGHPALPPSVSTADPAPAPAPAAALAALPTADGQPEESEESEVEEALV